jgi:hypothetical protein
MSRRYRLRGRRRSGEGAAAGDRQGHRDARRRNEPERLGSAGPPAPGARPVRTMLRALLSRARAALRAARSAPEPEGAADAASTTGLATSPRDPDPVAAMRRGYDLVALTLAAPLLVATEHPALRSSPRRTLLRLGVLAYGVYNYALLAFGTTVSRLFLAHLALFTSSVTALGLTLVRLDAADLAAGFSPRTPVPPVSLVLLVLGTSLGSMWAWLAFRLVTRGGPLQEPSRLVVPEASTRLGLVLDVTLLVPGYLLAAALLWRRAAWGFVLATMLLVSGTLHQAAYMTALVFQARAGVPGASAVDPAELPIAAAFAAAAVAMVTAAGSARTPAVALPAA